TGEVFGLLVVFQELVEQRLIDGHSPSFEWVITLLSYGHLHNPAYTLDKQSLVCKRVLITFH
ncbi:MAG TPA: hypothetical protein VJZ91_11795, partial [Blastocatellia bacterium]|nr:hypothetical protein [Blastocatellia bacterium]